MKHRLEDFPDHVQKLIKKTMDQEDRDRAPLSSSDVEQYTRDESPRPDEGQEVHPIQRPDGPFEIRTHHITKRAIDFTNFSLKWAEDALVIAGVLPDDSPTWVRDPKNRQSKGYPERTIIEVWEEVK